MEHDEPSEPNLKHQVIVKYEQIKGHVERNKPFYAFAGGIVVTAVVIVVTKRVDMRYLGGTVRTALLAKNVTVKDSGVLLIQTFERWTGSPSWMVRCVETGRVFTSQADAAKIMDLSPTTLSRHLNGLRDHVNGYHFVRVAMAIPRNG